jgi:SAM-dependent methyltransferase
VVEDIPFYLGACEAARAPVIEIGAGTGRIALPLLRAGHRVVALDRSRPMLDRLRERALAEELGERLTIVEGDLRSLPPLPATDRVIAPFRVLLHLADDDQRRTFLATVRSLLQPGGQLAFDVFEPTRADIRTTHDRFMTRPSGIEERARWDERSRQLELDVRLRGALTTMHLHWVPGRRWAELLAGAGFEVVAAYHGFDGAPFAGERGDSAWIAAVSES